MSTAKPNGNDDVLSVGFLDLGPASESVTIRNKVHPVYGLSALSVFDLIKKYPEVRAILEQRFQDITPESIMKVGPIVTLQIMSMGLLDRGVFDSEDTWLKAVNHGSRQLAALSIGEQVKVLNVVLKATMPYGKDPFIEELNQLKALFGADATSEPSMTSQKPSNGVSLKDLAGTTHGHAPQGN